MNSLHVESDIDDGRLVAALDEIYDGFLHRRAFVEDAGTGERLAPGLRARRWLVERDVYLALRRPRDRPPTPGLAREVDGPTLSEVEAATTRDEPYGRDEDVVGQLVAQREALARAVPRTRFFVGADDGVDAAVTTLYSDGAVAQVEDVATLRAHRGRGLARATVSLAVDAALDMGH
jgi:GNAT superfamily N-acetyltransferase